MNGLLRLLKLVRGREIASSRTAGRNLDEFNLYTRILSRWEKHRFVVVPHFHESKDQP